MGKEMVTKDDKIWEIKVSANELSDGHTFNKPMYINHQLLERVTNKAGVEMWKYRYWKIVASDVYRVSKPTEAERILKALNNGDVLFIKIENAYVNKRDIKKVEQCVGYKRIDK